MKREKSEAVRTFMEMKVEGKRERRIPKKKWSGATVSDMRTVGVYVDTVGDHVKWWFRTWLADPK